MMMNRERIVWAGLGMKPEWACFNAVDHGAKID